MSSVKLSERGKRSLPQADTAIVGGDAAIRPDVRRSANERLEVLQQQFILKDTAGEHDSVDAMGPADAECGIPQTVADSSLKRARDLRGISSS